MKTFTLRVPRPAEPPRLDRFLAAQIPEMSRRAARGLVESGSVSVGGRVVTRRGQMLQPGQTVSVSWHPGRVDPPPLGRDAVIARGDGWLALHKPAGLPSHSPGDGIPGAAERLAEALGAHGMTPVHRLDRGTSGVLVLAEGEARKRWSEAFEARAVAKRYLAVVSPAPSAEAGSCEGEADGRAMSLIWRVLRRAGERAELEVIPREGRTHQVRRLLSEAGTPIVGDVEWGVPIPFGAARLGLHCASIEGEQRIEAPPPAGWEELLVPAAEPVAPPRKAQQRPASPPSGLPSLRVSGATARVLRGGHPWVVRDRDTGDLSPFTAGDLVQLVDPRGDALGAALVDPDQAVCARLIGGGDPDWAARVEAALHARRALLDDPATTAFRLIHGEADGLPGLQVDRWGDVLVATRKARCAPTKPVYAALREALGELPLYEQDHLADLRRAGAPDDARLPGRWLRGAAPERFVVRERGLRFEVEPAAGLTTGLYTDQRANRDRLAPLAEGRTIANLFAHTGAFSVALAAAGAERVFAVDLGRRYLRWADANLEANGLDPARHPSVVADALDWLRAGSDPLGGVVLDPPSHARRKTRGEADWNARRDLVQVVEASARRLVSGGFLLCCVNLKGLKRGWLNRQVEQGVQRAGRKLARIDGAPPGPDHPRLRGFPEGTAFQGVLANLD